jgi:nucleotide-binding universal stress UspA family protein
MYDLNNIHSIQRWEYEGGKVLSPSRIPSTQTSKRHGKASNKAARRSCVEPGLRSKRTVVVPIDLAAPCTDGLEYALSYASKSGSEVLVLHVIPRFYGEGLIESHERKYLRQRAAHLAKSKLKRLVAGKGSAPVPVTVEVRRGFAEYEILKAAEAADAEMIVVGRRNRGVLRRMVFGSVTQDLLDASPIPVVVIPRKE